MRERERERQTGINEWERDGIITKTKGKDPKGNR